MGNAYRRLYENSLIIAPSLRQKELLRYRAAFPSASFKLISKEAFIHRADYQSDSRAEIYLIKKGYSYSVAKDILKAFAKYRSGKTYQSERLNSLIPLFEELLSLHYLFADFDPDGDLRGRHIVISGYADGSAIGKSLEEVKNLDTCFDLLPESKGYPKATRCRTIVEECHEVCYQIASMIDQGVDPSSIYIANYSEKYHFTLSLFAEYYGFTINLPSPSTYYSSPLGRGFLACFDEIEDADETIQKLRRGGFCGKSFEALCLLILTYQIEGLDKARQKEIYTELLKANSPSVDSFEPAVNLLNGYYAPEGSTVFFLDFSLGNSPKSLQKPAYFSENELLELGFSSLASQNEAEKNELLALLRSGAIALLSFHQRNFTENVFESPLIKDLGLKVIEPAKKDVEFSDVYASLYGRGLLDKTRKYGMNSLPDAKELQRYLPDDLKEYSNAFIYSDGSIFHKPHSYSFSGIDNYFKCPFSFYVSNVLKLPQGPSRFSARIGDVFHLVLQERFDEKLAGEPPFDYDRAWDKAVKEIEQDSQGPGPFTFTEKALLSNLKEDLAKIIHYIETKESDIKGLKRVTEYEVNAQIGGVPFYGKVDKAILFKGEKLYYAVIDYKTYAKAFEEKLLPFGLNMQLPIYSLLLNSVDDFKDATLAGVYFSPVTLSPATRAATDINTYGKELRLVGLFLDNADALTAFGARFDFPDYMAGSVKTKTGNYRYPGKYKTQEEFEEMAKTVTNNIARADKAIKEAQFPIHPAKWSLKDNACSMCSLRPYCYRRNGDFNNLFTFEKKEEEDNG